MWACPGRGRGGGGGGRGQALSPLQLRTPALQVPKGLGQRQLREKPEPQSHKNSLGVRAGGEKGSLRGFVVSRGSGRIRGIEFRGFLGSPGGVWDLKRGFWGEF